MTAQHTCPTKVYRSGWFSGHVCGRTAAHEHDGVMYCKTHHPPTVKAKDDARHAKAAAELAVLRQASDAKQAAEREKAHRANCFPDLLEALESIRAWMDDQSDAQSKGGHASFDLLMLREQRDIADAAIQKATHKEQT